jgi:PilZ domain-containing protein
MDERREAARFRKLRSGRVSFCNSPVPCTVKNVSESGACLEVQTTHGFPGKFTFAMSGEQPKVCMVKWANDKKLGVRFELSQC